MNLYKCTCRHINKSRGLHTVFKDGQAYTQTPYVPFSKIQCPVHENCACPFWKLDETLSVSVKTEVRILAVLDNAYMNLMVHRLLDCGKHLHYRIVSLQGQIWANKTNLAPTLLIGVPVSGQESEWVCIKSIRFYDLSIVFRDCSDTMVFFCLFLISLLI